MTGKQTFRGFVTCMNNKYKRWNANSLSFMSVNTFIDWWFGWASRMHVDFRVPCRACNGVSNVLACDGTKIGLSFKNLSVEPIEVITSDAPPLVTTTRRHDRSFLRGNKQAKLVLENVCRKIAKQETFTEEDKENNKHLEACFPGQCIDSFRVMISERTPTIIKNQHAKFFKLLCDDCSLDVILPYQCVIRLKDISATNLKELSSIVLEYCPELSQLLCLAMNNDFDPSSVVNVLRYIATQVIEIHKLNVEPESPSIVAPYNPAKYGRAYYFENHGCQIRNMRRFSVDEKSSHGNYDDHPVYLCNKKFPSVSKKGVSYLFLWFCPSHGHCYGFHVIPGSEGRKDPAASLYLYRNHAPEVIFYDFACSLSEYCHNRESGYFSNTRFFHDVFHGYTHVCSNGFRSDRLNSFDGINSSICEQFNSFLQKVKTSAKLMSQSHFTFYIQFFIHIWNEQKYQSFKRRLDIANKGNE